jgi:hypothetical protein
METLLPKDIRNRSFDGRLWTSGMSYGQLLPSPIQMLIMKITFWNIRGMNDLSKQRMLKKKILGMKADIVLLQETKCDKGNIIWITQRI